MINGSSGMVIGLDRRDVDITEWYSLTLTNAEQIKFYKNGPHRRALQGQPGRRELLQETAAG